MAFFVVNELFKEHIHHKDLATWISELKQKMFGKLNIVHQFNFYGVQ